MGEETKVVVERGKILTDSEIKKQANRKAFITIVILDVIMLIFLIISMLTKSYVSNNIHLIMLEIVLILALDAYIWVPIYLVTLKKLYKKNEIKKLSTENFTEVSFFYFPFYRFFKYEEEIKENTLDEVLKFYAIIKENNKVEITAKFKEEEDSFYVATVDLDKCWKILEIIDFDISEEKE